MLKKYVSLSAILVVAGCGAVTDAMPMRPYHPGSSNYVRPPTPRSPLRPEADPYTFLQKLGPLHTKIFARIFDDEERERTMRLADFLTSEDPKGQESGDMAVEVILQLSRKMMTDPGRNGSEEMPNTFRAPGHPPPRLSPRG
ncbi:MAG: hypothetical protein OXF02_01880 [Simkaniaceae bacterium]|nr:hypothetical protein [Simkaniaceae bacterium]